MGAYLQTRFQEAVQSAEQTGLAVNLYPESEVVELKQNGHQIQLGIKDRLSGHYFSKEAERALLATGHWLEDSDQDHYFTSPWPAKNYAKAFHLQRIQGNLCFTGADCGADITADSGL